MSNATIYKISGMDCMGCVKSITRCIKGIAPDAEVNVELETGKVSVAGDFTEAQMAEAAKMAGFTYDGVVA